MKQLRNRGKAPPVIILTARDPLTDRVKGLDAGADDYLVKPIALPELEARLRAVLRRAGGGDTSARFGNVELDAGQLHATADGKPLDLTAREFAALRALMRRQGRIVAKEQMFESMYDAESETNPNAIEVHVSRLRKKLEGAGADVGIRALRGLGYRLERWTP